MPKITKIKTILTAPEGINLVVVKVETDQDGLYGLGCGTFDYRAKAVQTVVDEYLAPLLIGRDANKIEDIWHTMNNNGYWRNGGIANNAIACIDIALWDIKGKIANLPLYELFGGKSREALTVYRHVNGKSLDDIVEKINDYKKQKYHHIRIQWGLYGGITNSLHTPPHSEFGHYFDPKQYMRDTVAMFDYVRKHCGDEIELIHDVHERLSPSDAIYLAKKLEPYRLFYLEDIIEMEQLKWLKQLRSQCATPIAIGELFNHPSESEYVITHRLIDFIRIHISQIGGITPARKLAILAEQFGIKVAWHGPGDVSPVGHAANLHISLNANNFGIQEWPGFSDIMYEIFPGMPKIKDGFLYANDKPGLGIDINEALAKKYPFIEKVTTWTQTRLPDGTIAKP